VLARTDAVAEHAGWDARGATLEEIVIGYLGQSQTRGSVETAARADSLLAKEVSR
jgi:hypothetical protein